MSEAPGPHHVLRQDGSTVEPWAAFLNSGSSVAVTNETHAKIHRGLLFSGGKIGAALGAAASAYAIFHNTSLTKALHIAARFSGAQEASLGVYLGVTGRTAGALVDSYNRLTGAVDTDVAAWWGSTPTGGTLADETFVPGGAGPMASGGSEFSEEWVVPAGGWIAYKATNLAAVSTDHYSFNWRFYLPIP